MKKIIFISILALGTTFAWSDDDKISTDIADINFDFSKFDKMIENNDVYQATQAFDKKIKYTSEAEKIKNLSIFLQKIEAAVNILPNYYYDIKGIPDRYESARKEAIERENALNPIEKPSLSWWDAVILPITIGIDCCGGCGFATGAYVAGRGAYVGNNAYNEYENKKNALTKMAKDIISNYRELSSYTYKINKYNNYKHGILFLEKSIDNLYNFTSISSDKKIRDLKNKLNEIKKNLSIRRCSFVSYSIIGPKFDASYRLARINKETDDDIIIKKAFLELDNSGPYIQSANNDIRDFFITILQPLLKDQAGGKDEYENMVAILTLLGNGKTGAGSWLSWE